MNFSLFENLKKLLSLLDDNNFKNKMILNANFIIEEQSPWDIS